MPSHIPVKWIDAKFTPEFEKAPSGLYYQVLGTPAAMEELTQIYSYILYLRRQKPFTPGDVLNVNSNIQSNKCDLL